MEKTLSIIKPDAVSKNVLGKILDRFESSGLKIVAIKTKTPKVDGIRNLNMSLEINLGVT